MRTSNRRVCLTSLLLGLLAITAAACSTSGDKVGTPRPKVSPTTRFSGLRELNPPAKADPRRITVITGACLIDGRGGRPIDDAVVIVRGDKIMAAGPRAATPLPQAADFDTVNAAGQTLLPGLIDVHFHLEGARLPQTYLTHGVTALRDPGEWDRAYDDVRHNSTPAPRLFLTGPHLDCEPVAHPETALPVKSAAEAVAAVNRFADAGDSCIKVYYRIPLDWFTAICTAAHARGIPVTAHLELVDADKGILAGLDGVEHVTSLGTSLAKADEVKTFKAAVTADNDARGPGRYALWNKLDLDHSPRVKPLLDLMLEHQTFFTPTLAVYEKQNGDEEAGPVEVHGFAQMMRFTGMAARAGVVMVVGSHSKVPHAPMGWAYQREMELMVETGISPLEVITAGTFNGARFLGAEDRLGTIEPGKVADLVLVRGNPLKDIKAMAQIERVMLGGNWVPGAGPPSDYPAVAGADK